MVTEYANKVMDELVKAHRTSRTYLLPIAPETWASMKGVDLSDYEPVHIDALACFCRNLRQISGPSIEELRGIKTEEKEQIGLNPYNYDNIELLLCQAKAIMIYQGRKANAKVIVNVTTQIHSAPEQSAYISGLGLVPKKKGIDDVLKPLE